MARCPRGYICLSDRWGLIVFILVLTVLITIGLVYILRPQAPADISQYLRELISVARNHTDTIVNISPDKNGFGDDIHTNPYIPPLKPAQPGFRATRSYYDIEDLSTRYPKNAINIPTRPERIHNFAQLGVITAVKDGKQTVMPLYGRPVDSRSDKYEYYTRSDGYQSYKMPVINNRDCTGEHGCQEVMDGNNVQVKGYDGDFTVQLYKTADPRREGPHFL
jgi:hypothetical protein